MHMFFEKASRHPLIELFGATSRTFCKKKKKKKNQNIQKKKKKKNG